MNEFIPEMDPTIYMTNQMFIFHSEHNPGLATDLLATYRKLSVDFDLKKFKNKFHQQLISSAFMDTMRQKSYVPKEQLSDSDTQLSG